MGILKYLAMVAIIMVTGASVNASTYHFATNDAKCVDVSGPGNVLEYPCHARMGVFVAPGDDGTFTDTDGHITIYRAGTPIGVMLFSWYPDLGKPGEACTFQCAPASLSEAGDLTSLYWQAYQRGADGSGTLDPASLDPVVSSIGKTLYASGNWDKTSRAPMPVPVPLPATLPLMLLVLVPLGLAARRRKVRMG